MSTVGLNKANKNERGISDAVFLDFWCAFTEILLLCCGINQAVCGIFKFSVILMQFAVFICDSVWCLNIILGGFAVFVPSLITLPSKTKKGV